MIGFELLISNVSIFSTVVIYVAKKTDGAFSARCSSA